MDEPSLQFDCVALCTVCNPCWVLHEIAVFWSIASRILPGKFDLQGMRVLAKHCMQGALSTAIPRLAEHKPHSAEPFHLSALLLLTMCAVPTDCLVHLFHFQGVQLGQVPD